MFCFEVSYPSCFSHFLLFQVSLLRGKSHFRIANQRVVFKKHWNKMLWHFQNKLFLSGNADMYVLSPYILRTAENVCHVSFILEAPKLHVSGLSFFFLDIFWGFFGLIQLLLNICFCRNKQREACKLGNGRITSHVSKRPGEHCSSWVVSSGYGTRSQQHLGNSPGYGWRQELPQCPFVSHQSYWRSSSEERDRCVQLFGPWF